MMNNLRDEANTIRLTSAEKQQMRATLFGVPAPFVPKRSPYFLFSYQFRMVLAGLVLVVFVGAGTAQAAQGALPGDLLYPIKVNVNEKVEVALAPTSEAKAQVEASLAQRRVDEAQTLEAQGRLDATTTQQIEDNFNEHASAALALAPAEVVAMLAPVTITSNASEPEPAAKNETAPVHPAAFAARTAALQVDSGTAGASTEAQTADQATSSAKVAPMASSTQAHADIEESMHIQANIERQRSILEHLKSRVLESQQEGAVTTEEKGQNATTSTIKAKGVHLRLDL